MVKSTIPANSSLSQQHTLYQIFPDFPIFFVNPDNLTFRCNFIIHFLVLKPFQIILNVRKTIKVKIILKFYFTKSIIISITSTVLNNDYKNIL